jgi:glycosyltransferase involved in cell wall biosynthesis
MQTPSNSSAQAADSRAAVLLATYNGARFLGPLLDSIVRQSFRSWTLYWRDDGSTDGTAVIVRSVIAPNRLVEVRSNGRLGPCASFLSILREASGRHDTYHFADQDDVWLPIKLERGHAELMRIDRPALFHCRQELIDANGTPLGLSSVAGSPSFENAVVENIVVGCSAAFNDAAARLGSEGIPTRALMHDWWMYLLVSGLGEIRYSPEPCIQYRQHANNAVGSNPRGIGAIPTKLRRHFMREAGASPICGQLSDLLSIHGHRLGEAQRSLVQELLDGRASPASRLRQAIATKARRQSALDQLLLRAVILAGRY